MLTAASILLRQPVQAHASEHLGTKSARQSQAERYDASLKERFKHHPEVKRIARHRHLPKEVYSATKQKRVMQDAVKRKSENHRANMEKSKRHKPDPRKGERKKQIVKQIE